MTKYKKKKTKTFNSIRVTNPNKKTYNQRKKKEARRKLINHLKKEFTVFRRNMPLSDNIGSQVVAYFKANLSEINLNTVRAAIVGWKLRKEYLTSILYIKNKYNLDLSICEPVVEREIEKAKFILAKKYQKSD